MLGFIKKLFKKDDDMVLEFSPDEYKLLIRNRAPAPHCDQNVLHAPGRCDFCDIYKDLQHFRITSGINFTGETDPEKKPCPATEARKLEDIERWPGNRVEGYRWTESLEKKDL